MAFRCEQVQKNFKTFLKKNCAVALDSYLVVTYFQKIVKYGIEHGIAYGVYIGTLDVHF